MATLGDLMAALGVRRGPLDMVPREPAARVSPDGQLDIGAIMAGAQVGQTAKSEYEPTLRPGEKRTPEELQAMLWNVVQSAGMESLPGIGPHRAPVMAPGARPKSTPKSIDPAALPANVLESMARTLRSKGFDVRGAEDARGLMQSRIVQDGKIRHPEWRAAYDAATAGLGAPTRKPRGSASRVNWDAIDALPTTESPELAGYIRPDGAMLDMSGGSGMRAEDHRIAGGTAGMQELVGKHGFVRWMPEGKGLDIGAEPTPHQLMQIKALAQRYNGEMVLDMERGLGDFDARNGYFRESAGGKRSMEFRRGTNPMEIIDAILSFYQGNE
jgi:hypothetical protein